MNCKNEEQMRDVIQTYGDLLYRTGYVLLGNPHDVQDILQEVFIKYMEKAPSFHDKEHEKAWLLKVMANTCKDCLRFRKRHTHSNLEDLKNVCAVPSDASLLMELLALPLKYKTVLLLHYVEGYQIGEIAHITGLSENAVKKRLQRGRNALKELLSDGGY
ncbi:RNA polymerase sigma factor [Parablautia muri]|uniref:RNA polymerase sigma factor n=1 Tax=Parablautia muri TaxID=2320879 RepID=A0A9X5BFF9_9FIRM|nr:RNA polymerase sigma factor [Parablautia muri]NBJ93064.1 RNA polymerase sigma factor [Parablautia muri]